MSLRRALLSICVAAFGFMAAPAQAKPGCNEASIFGSRLITDICWTCLLPIRLFGAAFGSNSADPPDANNNPVCCCPDDLGVPQFGFSVGAWLPYRLFEAVRNPYCMPTLGGIFMSDDWLALAGPADTPNATAAKQGSYYHTHVYSFPLHSMMDLLTSKECNPGGFMDMDLMLMSEFDPTASDELLAMFIFFETALFANPVGVAACALECSTLIAGVKPATAQTFWCAGCWGSLYPLTNRAGTTESPHNASSLVFARQLALKHRRGMGHKTYGTDNMCGGDLEPFMPKEQYRWQHLFPVPQAKRPCCHFTGQSEYLTGGVSRNRPYSGEDVVQVLFRYTDCCSY